MWEHKLSSLRTQHTYNNDKLGLIALIPPQKIRKARGVHLFSNN